MPSCYICRQAAAAYDMKVRKVHLHTFPSARLYPTLLEKWRTFARVPRGVDVTRLMLCSRHFPEEQFIRNPLCVKLKRDSVPILLPPATEGHVPESQKERHRLAMEVAETEKENSISEPFYVLVQPSDMLNARSPFTGSTHGNVLKLEDIQGAYDKELLDTVRCQLCRVCGTKQENLLPIYTEAEGDELTLSKKIEMYLPVEIGIGEGLPSNICQNCCSLVESWHELHTTSLAADSILRSMFTTPKNEMTSQNLSEGELYNERLNEEDCSEDSDADASDEVLYAEVNGNSALESETEESVEVPQNNSPVVSENVEITAEHSVPRAEEPDLNEQSSVEHNNSVKSEGRKLPPLFKCKFCGQELSYRISGENGQENTAGNKEKPLPCAHCDNYDHRENTNKLDSEVREFLKKVERQMARKGEKEYPLESTKSTENNPMYRSAIMSTVYDIESPETVFTCIYCGHEFPTRETELTHRKQCVLEPVMCDRCGRMFSSRKDFRNHAAKHTYAPVPTMCEKCGKICASRSKLKLHMKNRHSDTKFVCEPCCKVFSNGSSYHLHQKRHGTGEIKSLNVKIDSSGEGMFICPVCKEVFQDKLSVIVHMNATKKVKCPTCKICVSSERCTLLHKCRLLNCKFCPRSFNRVSSKHVHEFTHTGEKPYSCSVCGKTFRSPASLYSHRFIHQPPSFKCAVCDKNFKRKIPFVDHVNSHAGAQHLCVYCDQTFGTRKAMYKHRMMKHRDKIVVVKHI